MVSDFALILILTFAPFSLLNENNSFSPQLVCSAIKLNSISVPSTYVLKSDEPNNIVLDCDYTVDESEPGFVLKWYLHDFLVYQWIPGTKTPFGVVNCSIINS